jgi:glycosyltransferase involved in cell wall biosynthesis
MAAGTPVLAYRRCSTPELIKNGETGYLFDNEDEMVETIQRVETLDLRALSGPGALLSRTDGQRLQRFETVQKFKWFNR